MPEIKIKHVASFSSEDKVHKAENLIKPETYRKWKCATPGEKTANVVLQFEKATQIHSIDIGNENSAFVEVLVGRSSDSVSDFQVLLVASSFMSPLESRNGTHGNRVRMFGSDKLSQNVKDEKWDCVQIVCTQPFNKTITYGLTFVKFHSPPEKNEEQPKVSEAEKMTSKIGPFKIMYEDDDDDNSLPAVGSWFEKKKNDSPRNSNSSTPKDSPSYATAVLSSQENEARMSQNNTPKRKSNEESKTLEPPAKKPATNTLNKDHIVYKNVLDIPQESKNTASKKDNSTKSNTSSKPAENAKTAAKNTSHDKPSLSAKPSSNARQAAEVKEKKPFNKLMDKVVIVLSGFVNPLRSELREKALEMGAKYKGDWDVSCTHLICAFLNTPKYTQVNKLGGKIVSKEWIIDCHKKKQLLPWKKYALANSADSSDESEESESDYSDDLDESEEEYTVEKKKRTYAPPKICRKKKTSPQQKTAASKAADSPKKNGNISSPKLKGQSSILSPKKKDVVDSSQSSSRVASGESKDESETEDEDAIEDYMAKTDVESDSGQDTEDEIRKVENKAREKAMNFIKGVAEVCDKPVITDLPLPDLPNLFKQKHFFLYGDFSSSKQHELQRYITAYNGVLEDYMSDKIKYVITEKQWDKDFDEALNENEDLIFVKSAWIYKCHDVGKLVPYQPFIIIPDS